MYVYRCERRIDGIKCHARTKLGKAWWRYVIKPPCKKCKKPLTGYQEKESTCYCNALVYPHRAGSVVWCEQHSTGPTDKDFEERYGG